ncbi:MAG: IS66 family insertion sequence element accessory protein TnpB [Eubacterium sp.]|nr:IS66 family insertion sequence element accessory protein TnpB [Eubacterium sp.]
MSGCVRDIARFCGRKRSTLKTLYFDQTGFVLCTKRLDKESFQVELQVIHRLLLFFLILLFQ